MPTTTPNFGLPYPLGAEPPDGPAQIGALANRLDVVLGAFDTNVVVGAASGPDTIQAIPDGSAWSSVEAAAAVTVPKPGILLVVGSVYLQHLVSTGDPQARVEVSGAVTDYVSSSGRLGTGQTGGIEVWASVPVMAKAQVTAAGTLTLQRQVRHHISGGTGHKYANFDIYWVFVGEADA